MKNFRQMKLNLLCATSVLEEGVDVRQCNVVIRYDPPKDFRSYVQSKGPKKKRYFVTGSEKMSFVFLGGFIQDERENKILAIIFWSKRNSWTPWSCRWNSFKKSKRCHEFFRIRKNFRPFRLIFEKFFRFYWNIAIRATIRMRMSLFPTKRINLCRLIIRRLARLRLSPVVREFRCRQLSL